MAPALPEGAALDFASFVRLMTSKAVSEFQKPDQELLPIFEALGAFFQQHHRYILILRK